MVERVAVLLESLATNDVYIERLFAALGGSSGLYISNPMLNHPLWLLAHIIEARFFLLRQLGKGLHPSWGNLQVEKEDIDNPDAYPTPVELEAAWEKAVTMLPPALKDLSEEDLSAKPDYELPLEDKTLWGTLFFITHHETYHIGQLGSWYRTLSAGELMK